MSEFVASVEALADGARELDAPVISGNVSFYNETLGKNIPPTPATGVVGLRDDVEDLAWDEFPREGLHVLRLACPMVKAFHRIAEVLGEPAAFSGRFDAKRAAAFVRFVTASARAYKWPASRAIGDGGLVVALSRMSKNGVGLSAGAELAKFSAADLLAENLLEIVVAVPPEHSESLLEETGRAGFVAERLGTTMKGAMDLGAHGRWTADELLNWNREAWTNSFGEM